MSTIQNKEHKVLIEMVKKAAKICKVKCGILLDLQGPVIRFGEFRDHMTSVIHSTDKEYNLFVLGVIESRVTLQNMLQEEDSGR
jgi:pyruvate kinase